jgi:diaminohydroxyphosphoribosylaminopyrimidine deaminase / 5-amino-6-(5-phosphoribosylamino)uracil reductase
VTSAADSGFMRRALELAARARGLTSPNPMVGAVLVRKGMVVGEGCHWRAGGPHAEIEALGAAGTAAAGATLYITLEPCAHHGRTPPCAPVVVRARVARVVAAMVDPNPLVAGRGLNILRDAGIDVDVGLLGAEAAALNRAFATAMRERRPHVTLKAGMTLDGRIADLHGVSQWITGEPARRHAHRMRAESDAIVVGVGTVLRDDPRLDVRLEAPWPREPLRVVLDSAARTPPTARVLHAGDPARTLVVVTPAAPPDRVRGLAAAGASIVDVAARDGRVDVVAVLSYLFDRDVRAVLVEGGGEVHASFLDAEVVDRVAMFVAPTLLGGRQAVGAIGGRGRELKNAVRLAPPMTATPLGDDLLIEADLVRA